MTKADPLVARLGAPPASPAASPPTSPPASLAFDTAQIQAAAQRWQRRTPLRDKKMEAVAQGRFDIADSKERVAARVNRLMAQLPTGAGGDGAAAALEAATVGAPAGVLDNPFVERMIGATRDFLFVEFLDQGRLASRAVARIVTRYDGGGVSYGTGFLVSPTLLMTNNHVLPNETDASNSVAEFDYAHDAKGQSLTTQFFALRPDLFYLTDKELDFALVAVAPKSKLGVELTSYPFLPLMAAEGKILTGEFVNIVQHPKGETKQVVIRGGKLVDIGNRAASADAFVYYEADTEPGSSGSPVFNDQWEVVALHHSGVPKTGPNGETLDTAGNPWHPGDDPTRIDWIANEGVRVSRLLAFFDQARQSLAADPKRAYLEALLLADPGVPSGPIVPKPEGLVPGPPTPPDRPSVIPREAPRTVPQSYPGDALRDVGRSSDGQTTITLPFAITISLGSGGAAPRIVSPQVDPQTPDAPGAPEPQPDRPDPPGAPGDHRPALVIEENFKPDQDYQSRPGYDPGFLAFDLPLPALDNSVASQAATLADGSSELKYHHYSVLMNQARRVAFVSAVNVDVDARAKIGREGADVWSFDPRIPKSAQAGAALYRNNPLDKGHLTRRQDGAWGPTQKEAQAGNDDTFHWTNCSPQHEVFNQSQKATSAGVLLWGNLENHVTEQAKLAARRICVFNGPVLRKDDTTYRGVQLPRQFWKIIVMQGDDGSPNAVGFLLSQATLIADLPQENFDAGAFEPFQVKIADIERLSKLDFGDLRRHDALNIAGAERSFESDTSIVHLRSPANIVLHGR